MKKYVWIKPVSQFRNLWQPLAQNISQKKNLKPLMIVATEEDKKFYLSQNSDWHCQIEFVVQPSLYEIAITESVSETNQLITKANELERRFGISLWRDFLQQDRHLGRGMVWGWNGKPKSRASEKSTFTGRLMACLESFRFYDELFASYPPSLVVGYALGTGISTKPLPLICREKKLPFRSLSSSRLSSEYYWATDEYNNSSELERAIIKNEKKYTSYLQKDDVEVEPNAFYQHVFNKSGNRRSLLRACKLASHQLIRGAYLHFKGHKKSKFGYYTSSTIASTFYNWWAHMQTSHYPFIKMEELPQNQKLVLFPLQYEFEASLYGESPESNSLLTAIYETATSLPIGCTLVVKEHPLQPGRRPTFFYKLILRLPNVVLLRPQVSSLVILSKCSAVVQINSSLGYEAII